MTANAYEINKDLQLVPVSPEDAAKDCRKSEAGVWIDVLNPEPGEFEKWLDALDVKDLARRLCMELKDRSGFYPLKNEIFFMIPVLAATDDPREMDFVGFLCRKNLLLTFHEKPVFNAEELSTIDQSQAWLADRSIASLVSAMVLDVSLRGMQYTSGVRRSIFAMEERMDREPREVEADEILEVRSDLIALDTVVSDQLPCLLSLSATDKHFFNLKASREYMNSALANLQSADSSLDRLDKRIDGLRSGFEMYAQEKTNRRLNMLTILSMIFSPITLMAGVWGMNFEFMPELKFQFAYPVALGLMALTGWGMYFFFRRTGWFN